MLHKTGPGTIFYIVNKICNLGNTHNLGYDLIQQCCGMVWHIWFQVFLPIPNLFLSWLGIFLKP